MPLFRLIPDIETRQIFLTSLFVLVESLQFLVLVALVYSHIPIVVDPFIQELFPLYQQSVKPEREIRFYHFFVFFGFALQAMTLFVLRNKLSQKDVMRTLQALIVVELFWLALMVFAIFKIILFGNPLWARVMLYVALGFSIVTKVFWVELLRVSQWIKAQSASIKNKKALDVLFSVGVGVVIVSVIMVWDVQKVLGMMAVWGDLEQFQQWRARYYAGFALMKDEAFLRWLMAGAAVYFVAMYAFLRVWLKSGWLASGAVFLAIKWQLFHWGVTPIVWQYPHKLNGMMCVDLILFLLLCAGIRRGSKRLFWIAVVGLSVETIRYVVIAWTTADVIMLPTVLRGRQFFAYVWQYVIPVIYAVTWLDQMTVKEKSRRDWVVIMASVLGMGIFAQHVNESTLTNYYTHSLALVVVVAYWSKRVVEILPSGQKNKVSILWAVVMLVGLLTNQMQLVYPNVLNVSGIAWDQVKAEYQKKGSLKF